MKQRVSIDLTYPNHPNTCFDLSQHLRRVGSDGSAIDAFLRTNSSFLDLSRIRPATYRVKGTTVIFESATRYPVRAAPLDSGVYRLAERIAASKPSTTGGRHLTATFDQIAGPRLWKVLCGEWLVPKNLQEEFGGISILEGKLFKSHTIETYSHVLQMLFQGVKAAFEAPTLNVLMVINESHPLARGDGAIRGERVADFLRKLTKPSFELLVSSRRHDEFAVPEFSMDSDALRSEITGAWAHHLNRSPESVSNALRRSIRIDRARFAGDENDLNDIIWAAERLSPEIVDELGAQDVDGHRDEIVRPIVGVDQFKITANGLEREGGPAKPRVSASDLLGKYKAAKAAFLDVEGNIEHLENTHYRHFKRMIAPLREAMGTTLADCDVVMLACLRRPFARLLAAAKRDEETAGSIYSDFEPIREASRAQLDWLSSALTHLCMAFEGNAKFEDERKRLEVTESDLAQHTQPIRELIEELEGIASDVAKRLKEYLQLHAEAKGRSPEIAHVVLASVHNIMLSMVEILAQLSSNEPASGSQPKLSAGVKPKPGWDKFRERVGTNLADLVASRLTWIAGAAVVVLNNWFSVHGPALSDKMPGLFSALQRMFEQLPIQ